MRFTAAAAGLLLLSSLFAAPTAQALPGQMWVGSASSGCWESSFVRPWSAPTGFEWLDPSWEIEFSVVRGDPTGDLTEVHAVIPTIPALEAHLRRGTLVLAAVIDPEGETLLTIEPSGRFDPTLDDVSRWLEVARDLSAFEATGTVKLSDGTFITL